MSNITNRNYLPFGILSVAKSPIIPAIRFGSNCESLKHPCRAMMLFLLLFVGFTQANVFISEFDAINIDPTLYDDDGDKRDWIEISNSGSSSVNLDGWALTDDPKVPDKWIFPSVSISAGGQILVFASGKNWSVAGVELHTNFKLDDNNGTIQLNHPTGDGKWTVVSEILDYPKQRPGLSYGRDNSSPTGTLGYFESPSPSVCNGAIDFTEFVGDTEFSVDRGIYYAAFDTIISTDTAGATIIYTLDGSEPTLSDSNGTQVPAPDGATPPSATVHIATTATLRAVAVKSGMGATNIDTHTYIFPADVLRQNEQLVIERFGSWSSWGHSGPRWDMNPAVTDPNIAAGDVCEPNNLLAIPTVSLVLDWDDMFGSTGIYSNLPGSENVKKRASFEVINPHGSITSPNLAEGSHGRGEVDIFGAQVVAYKNSKQQMGFNFWRSFSSDVLGDDAIGEYDKLVIDPQNQHTWLNWRRDSRTKGDYARDVTMSDFQNAMGDTGTHGQAVHFYINGLYWGVYHLKERPDNHFAAAYLGGIADDYDVVKHNRPTDPNKIVDFIVDSQRTSPTDTTPTALTNFDQLLSLAAAVGSDPNNPAAYDAVAAILDIPEFINHILLNFWAQNTDWAKKNWYASFNRNDPDGKWRFHQWDAELVLWNAAFWNTDLLASRVDMNWPGGPTAIHTALSANADYRRLFGDIAHKLIFNDGLLVPANAQAMFDARHMDIDDAIRAESARWGYDRAPENYLRSTNMPGPNSIVCNSWLTERARMYALINGGANMTTTLLYHLRTRKGMYPTVDAPVFSRHGGFVALDYSLTMTNPGGSGTIYYTQDGSDPRAYDGSPNGTAYSGAVTLSISQTVKARVRDGSDWSALNEAYFSVDAVAADAGNLAISKIHYHPAVLTIAEIAAGFSDRNEFEFLEVMNISGSKVNLDGISFAKGVRIAAIDGGVREIAPGERALYVKDPRAFEFRYGSGLPIAGKFTRGTQLDNSGERLHLLAAGGADILDFSYDDETPWPTTPDGDGPSLVLANPYTGNPALGTEWRASNTAHGSPGVDDTISVVPVKVNEALTHTDWPVCDAIELYNPDAASVNIGGWYLSDNGNNRLKWRIPDGTTIPGNGYLTFYEGHYSGSTFEVNADEFGSAFSLSSWGEEVYLSSPTMEYSHGFQFGASENGVSFGRYITSDGQEHFPAQDGTSFGRANNGPKVGPVVISEIMYNPPTGDHEFLELVNISASPVQLYNMGNNWIVSGVGFTFPDNIVIQPGKVLLLVENTITPSAFAVRYNVPAGTQIFNYSGKLDNGGERIRLRKPDSPDGDTVPYITVDEVDYSDKAPWPTAPDGNGPSLERVNLNVYGNDPINWQPSILSGGTPGVGGQGPIRICGTVANVLDAPVEGVLVTAAGDGGSDTTDSGGYYELLVPYGWSDTLTAVKEDYTFESPTLVLPATADQVGDFAAQLDADLNNSGNVDLLDLQILCSNWLTAGDLSTGDLDGSGLINLLDFSEMAEYWLK